MSEAYQFEGHFHYGDLPSPDQAGDRLLVERLAPAMHAMTALDLPVQLDLRRSREGGAHWAVQLRCDSLEAWQRAEASWAAAGASTHWQPRALEGYGYEDAAARRHHWHFDDLSSRLALRVINSGAALAERSQFWQLLLMRLIPASGLSAAECHFLMQFLRRHWATVRGQALPVPLNAAQRVRWAPLAQALCLPPGPLAELLKPALEALLPLAPGLLRRDAEARPTMASWARLMLFVHAAHNRDGQGFEQEQRFCILGEALWGSALDEATRSANAAKVGLSQTLPASSTDEPVLQH